MRTVAAAKADLLTSKFDENMAELRAMLRHTQHLVVIQPSSFRDLRGDSVKDKL